MTIEDALAQAIPLLAEAALARGDAEATPRLDAELIASHATGLNRASVVAHPERSLSAEEEAAFLKGVAARARGLPVAYVTGTREFWGLPFSVNTSVLIPKSDTETLVELALDIISKALFTRPFGVLDVCTGSGAIACALKASEPSLEITATDISEDALAVARANARALTGALSPAIRFVRGDLREGLPPRESSPSAERGYDLIVSNPPYVPTDLARDLLTDGRGEPLLALDGGIDGLDLVRALADRAAPVLAAGGKILIETGEYNAREASEYLSKSGFTAIVIHRDLSGRDRVVEGTLR